MPRRLLKGSRFARYGVAIGAAAAATVVRLSLDPVWASRFPFILFFPAVMLSSWFGGLWPGVVTTALATVATEYYWIEPRHSWAMADKSDLLGLLVFAGVGCVISALNEAWRRGAAAVVASDERLRVMVSSIGDAVIATDAQGRVTILNTGAQQLTGWKESDALGRPLEDVFIIVNELTRLPAHNPVHKVLQEGVLTGLANHTVLVSRDGREIPIDDSAAPIRTADGELTGVVMVFRDITGRRQSERERGALLQSTQMARAEAEHASGQLRIALESGRMGTWQYTMRTGAVTWSPGLEAIHGLPPGGFPGTFEAFRNEIHPDDRDRVLEAITEAVNRRREHHIEYRIIRGDGAVRWVEERGQLLVDDQGQPDRMLGVCSDITERKQTEERLSEQAALLETINDAIYETDSNLVITGWNSAAEQMFGYTAAEAIGRRSFELLQSTVGPEQREAFVRRIEAGEIVRTEAELRTKNGSAVWSDITAIAKRRADGTLAGFIAVNRDITARKRADERFRLAVDAAPAAVIMIAPNGTIALVNTLAETLFGYARDELLGQPMDRLVPLRFRDRHPEYRRTFFESPTQRPMGVGRDLRALRKDGSEVPVEIGLSPIETADGRFVLAAITDITERQRTATALEEAVRALEERTAEAEQANRVKAQFLANMSHDLRTPLNAIMGYVDLLDAGVRGPILPEQLRDLQRIKRSGSHLLALINEVLDFAKVEAGHLQLRIDDIPVESVLAELQPLVEPQVRAKGLEFKMECDPNLTVRADREKLDQILVNLVGNAIKFTDGQGRIDVVGRAEGTWARMEVRDTGEGIAVDQLDAVFAPFVSVERRRRPREPQGIGLGLSISRELARAMSGELTVTSVLGEGSIFTLRLPRGGGDQRSS